MVPLSLIFIVGLSSQLTEQDGAPRTDDSPLQPLRQYRGFSREHRTQCVHIIHKNASRPLSTYNTNGNMPMSHLVLFLLYRHSLSHGTCRYFFLLYRLHQRLLNHRDRYIKKDERKKKMPICFRVIKIYLPIGISGEIKKRIISRSTVRTFSYSKK